MITPFEIENKDFSRSMRGYNIEEVDEFLDEIILDLQKILVENEKMKEEINVLNADLKQYKKSESSVLNTLESAKKLMNDISESAEKRAEIIIRNAQMDAEVIQRDARESISKLTEEGERLKEKVGRFRDRYRQMLEDEMNSIEGSSEELFADLEKEFIPASMDSVQKKPAAPDRQRPVQEETVVMPAAKAAGRNTRETVVAPKATGTKPKPSSKDTLIIDENSLDQLLEENFGVKPTPKDDLKKTRIIK
ncbi:MAG: DivIVA domain-containing protein [Emergencia sp.]|nr:DivIVA domain-containing protein [Emergencia sp.]